VERRGAVPAHYVDEAHRGGEPTDVFRRNCDTQERRGEGRLGLNSNAAPLIPHA
jgi:hypothetical protein